MKTLGILLSTIWAFDLCAMTLTTCQTDVVRFREDSTFQYRYSLSYIAVNGQTPKLLSINFNETQIYFAQEKAPVLEGYRRNLSSVEDVGPGEFRVYFGRGAEDSSADKGYVQMDASKERMTVRLPWVTDPYTGEVLKFKEFEGESCSKAEV